MALEHKNACEKVEQDLKTLQDAYDSLERELTDKEEELQIYQKDGGMDDDVFEVQNLQGKIKTLESEKAELETQIRLLQKDAAQLLEKDGRVTKERSEERKTLQTVIFVVTCLISGDRRAADSTT
jgi:chromosome segregation ATPase